MGLAMAAAATLRTLTKYPFPGFKVEVYEQGSSAEGAEVSGYTKRNSRVQ